MAWRTLLIQNPAKLSLSKNQLALHNEQGQHSLPLEDIAAIILESPKITLTSALLSASMGQGIVLLTCDVAHMPNGALLPFLPHSRQSKVAHIQLSWSEPLKKRLWQRIVQTKIMNQALCLAACQNQNVASRLFTLARKVQSGDPDNMEAQAARYYWPNLFGEGFLRGSQDSINSALNYGYAVIRAFVARSQVSYGLLPSLGLHHASELNAFNLTDDVMEIFRPMADFLVFQMYHAGELSPDGNLSKENRQKLALLGAVNCRVNNQTQNIMNASDDIAVGLVNAIEQKTAALIPMPEFISV